MFSITSNKYSKIIQSFIVRLTQCRRHPLIPLLTLPFIPHPFFLSPLTQVKLLQILHLNIVLHHIPLQLPRISIKQYHILDILH